MTNQETLSVLLKEVLEIKNTVNQLKIDKELSERQFRSFSAFVEEPAKNYSNLEREGFGAGSLLASGRHAG